MAAVVEKQVVVIAGPSGSGKNAVIDEVLKRYPRCARLVTAATRAMRPGEVDGVDYHFLSQEKFLLGLATGSILEHRHVAALDTYYGIYLPDLAQKISEGRIVFAQVDIVGARLLKERYAATTIFIMPESIEQFRGRLRVRNPEWSPHEFEARMRITEDEIRLHASEYDYRVTNSDGKLAEAVRNVVDILVKEGYTLSS